MSHNAQLRFTSYHCNGKLIARKFIVGRILRKEISSQGNFIPSKIHRDLLVKKIIAK